MTRKTIWIWVVCFSLMGCAARNKTVTDLPAGVTQQQVQNWDSAVANLDKIAHVTSTVRQSVMALNAQKQIPDGKIYGAMLTSIGKIDQAQIDAVQFLKAQPKNWGASTQAKVKNDLELIQAELQNITQQQLAGIKNADAQTQIQRLIAEIGAAASLVLSLTT